MLPDHSRNLHTRNEVMKPAHIFRDQVNTVAQWFDQWNDIEQTIACYSLLKRLGPTQARFLSLVLDHTFRDSAYEVQVLEEEANGKEFLRSLCHESKEVAVQQLLLHLPLLHPGNDEARHEYLKLLPKILSHSLEYSIHEEECRQLLSLALVHPAFVPEERNSLTWWLGLLEDKGEKMREKRQRPPPGFNPSSINAHSPLSGTKSAGELWGSSTSYQHAPITNTISYKTTLAPNGFKGQPPLTHTDSGISTSFDNGHVGFGGYSSKGFRHDHDNNNEDLCNRPSRSKSFPVDPANMHMPLSPQSSMDSDEENQLRKMNSLAIENAHPGMKDVPMWLKSLRLHKYSHIFTDITYEQMLGLTEDYLEQKGVTKGARNKIILCIQKIKERRSTLIQLEKEVLQLGRLPNVLSELKNILMSPIRAPKNQDNKKTFSGLIGDDMDDNNKPFSEEEEDNVNNETESKQTEATDKTEESDKPATYEKSEQTPQEEGEINENKNEDTTDEEEEEDLPSEIVRVMGKACTQILVTQPDEECCLTYLGLLERVLSHEAFSQNDKRRLQSWKAQCQKLARQLATNRKLMGIEKGPKNWYDPLGYGGSLGRRRPTNRTSSLKSGSLLVMPGGGRAGPLVAAQNIHKKLGATNSYHNSIAKGGHQSLSRTKSAPIRSNNLILQPPSHTGIFVGHQDTEGINKSLESLCVSMTNHALDDTHEKCEDTF